MFVSIPGHSGWTFDDSLFRILLLREIAWAAHGPLDRFNELVTPGARMSRRGPPLLPWAFTRGEETRTLGRDEGHTTRFSGRGLKALTADAQTSARRFRQGADDGLTVGLHR